MSDSDPGAGNLCRFGYFSQLSEIYTVRKGTCLFGRAELRAYD